MTMPPSSTMRTTIEQAISDLIVSNKAITVANAFPIYMRLAGFNGLCDEALVSFEHAMDKYPAQPPKVRPKFSKEIKELRDGYWSDKLGGTSDGGGACYQCQEYFSMLAAEGILEGKFEVTCELPEKPPRRLKKTKKSAKRIKPARNNIFDPYGASTSAVLL